MPLSVWIREMYMLLSQLLQRQRPSITNAWWAALLFSSSLKYHLQAGITQHFTCYTAFFPPGFCLDLTLQLEQHICAVPWLIYRDERRNIIGWLYPRVMYIVIAESNPVFINMFSSFSWSFVLRRESVFHVSAPSKYTKSMDEAATWICLKLICGGPWSLETLI